MDYIGIDEVGRGAWAGPLLVVAIRGNDLSCKEFKDSKSTSIKKRELQKNIIQRSFNVGEGWVFPREIEKLGLTNAMKLGVKRALEDIGATKEEQIIIDGNINYCPENFSDSKAVIKADETISVVSAASIYAKVTRDDFMYKAAKKYPNYKFDRNVGYGTSLHSKALENYGICELHRRNYKPIRKYINA